MSFVNMTTEHHSMQEEIMWCWRVIPNQIMEVSCLFELHKFITIIFTHTQKKKYVKDYL